MAYNFSLDCFLLWHSGIGTWKFANTKLLNRRATVIIKLSLWTLDAPMSAAIHGAEAAGTEPLFIPALATASSEQWRRVSTHALPTSYEYHNRHLTMISITLNVWHIFPFFPGRGSQRGCRQVHSTLWWYNTVCFLTLQLLLASKPYFKILLNIKGFKTIIKLETCTTMSKNPHEATVPDGE